MVYLYIYIYVYLQVNYDSQLKSLTFPFILTRQLLQVLLRARSRLHKKGAEKYFKGFTYLTLSSGTRCIFVFYDLQLKYEMSFFEYIFSALIIM